jgi:cobalamin biosynthesis Mg chelatase CobN
VTTIKVSARGVTTVREALDEVDALVEALKNRADEVLHLVGRELERAGDDADDDRDDDDSSLLSGAAKGAATLLATKAATTAAGSAARQVRTAAEDATRKAAKRAAKQAKSARKAGSRKASRKAAKKARKTAKRLKGQAVQTASDLVERAPESLHLPTSKRASRSRTPVVVLGMLGAAAVVAVLVWRQQQRTRELRAVDNTAPDEFGAMVERAELASTRPPVT